MTTIKTKIGIGLLIIINLIFIYVIIFDAILSFGIIVGELGEIQGKVVEKQTSQKIIFSVLFLSLISALINFIIFKKLIPISKKILFSLLITTIDVLIFIPFFLQSRNSFLDYEIGTTKLIHFIEKQNVEKIKIIKNKDTVETKQKDIFLKEIGSAKYKRGILKYKKNLKIIFERNDKIIDSINSNGTIFGPYKNRYFEKENNVIEKYLKK